MAKPKTFSTGDEVQFLKQEILGSKVTDVGLDDNGDPFIEFDGQWRVVQLQTGFAWLKRSVN